MRIKMREHLLNNSDDKVDLKQCEGGITDIEFMAQYWVLAHAHQLDALTVYPDNLRIFDAAASGSLIKQETANELQKAYLALREQYHHLTLADTKFADQTEELEVIRERVTSQYNALFGKCGTS
jgi:glutamate-ammonia-ligase adenylyltransferase